jgi:hypothetical protein
MNLPRTVLLFLLLFTPALRSEEAPFASKQFPDLASLPDRTDEFRKRLAENSGTLLLEPGVHRITGTLEIVLAGKHSAVLKPASGPATLVMDGAGPAIRIAGSHEGTASPKSFEPSTFHERMPVIEGIEILGNHPEADGIELVRTFEAVVSKVSVRWCRTGIRLFERNRNVTISDVNLYENRGIGLHLDDVNLHQINVSNSHISYNRGGGIVVRDGNVRNLQITGCDIEANMPDDDTTTETANLLLDVSGTPDDKSRSICEVAVTGCTLQHSSNYSGKEFKEIAPGGANIRILGKEAYPIDSVTLTGNVLSDVSVNVDLRDCTDITLTGNTFFAPNPDNLHVTRGRRIVVDGNTFNPREFERPGRIVFDQCQDCVFSNNTLRALLADDGAVVVKGSARLLLDGNLLTESRSGVRVEASEDIAVSGWLASGLPDGTPLVTKDAASARITGPDDASALRR